MISPEATKLLIRHFDAIDFSVSRRLVRKRPWSEPALTSLLCDLLDEETQAEERLRYSLEELNRDLQSLEGYLSLSFEIETHEYDSRMERWVTQADLGLIIRFSNNFVPNDSWSSPWLLQAKRIYPSRRSSSGRFDETSRFEATDAAQLQRIQKLIEVVQDNFVLFLLYCPRPESLDELTRQKLAYLRTTHLSGEIFDYTLGLQLHSELSSSNPSLAAGLFLCDAENVPGNPL